MMRHIHWSTEEIRALSTRQIIRKLRSFGIVTDEKRFRREVQNFRSAEQLDEHWEQVHTITAKGFDLDFTWMAAIILWERLVPDVMSSEQLDDMMQKGYALLRAGKTAEACTIWLQVWEHLKKRFTPDIHSIDDAESVFSGTQFLSNWCQDLAMELANAGLKDISFCEKLIQYCREFYTLLPETDSLIIHNMKGAEAESYFALGMRERGETLFQSLIKEFPNSAWAYIFWGDVYWLFRRNPDIPLDYAKAEWIYRMALDRDLDEREEVLSRLQELEQERRRAGNSR
jgi:tetratricopeptide (TPR) repeat protein